MWGPLLALALVVSPGTAEPWTSLSGSGLLTLPDVATLEPGRFALGVSLDNRDRDPLGLDLLDYSVTWSLGVVPRLEAYGRHVMSRVVSLPEAPALPPPPLDLVVPAGAMVPLTPYHSFYSLTPYVDRSGPRHFGAFVPGDAVLGLKLRLAEPAGRRPGLAASVEAKAPLSAAVGDLKAGSGTGGVDGTGRITTEWRAGRHAFVASAAYTRVGSPPFGDRIVLAGESGHASVSDEPLRLPDRLDVGLGGRRALSRRIAAVAEATAAFEVGDSTPSLDAAWPLDALAGVQLRWGRLQATAGLRYHGHDLRSGAERASPLGSYVDLTGVGDGALAAYLASLGASEALAHLRPGSRRLLAARTPGPLPEGARRLPDTYRIRSEHQVGFVLAWGWAF